MSVDAQVFDAFRMEGKVILITGGTSGLGKTMARIFLQAGAHVYVTARGKEKGLETVKELSRYGPIEFFPADVGRSWDVEQLFTWLKQRTTQLHVLVNNAGIMQVMDLTELSVDDWDREIQVHVRGAFLCTQQALAFMLGQGQGAILNIASYLGLRGGSGFTPAYSAAKGALISFTRSLASRYGPYGIRVNAVCPAFIPTNLNRKVFTEAPDPEKKKTELEQRYPLRRLGEPDDVGYAALFLCSDAASWITGAVLTVDGGLTAT